MFSLAAPPFTVSREFRPPETQLASWAPGIRFDQQRLWPLPAPPQLPQECPDMSRMTPNPHPHPITCAREALSKVPSHPRVAPPITSAPAHPRITRPERPSAFQLPRPLANRLSIRQSPRDFRLADLFRREPRRSRTTSLQGYKAYLSPAGFPMPRHHRQNPKLSPNSAGLNRGQYA